MNEIYFFHLDHHSNELNANKSLSGFITADSYADAMSELEVSYNIVAVHSLIAIDTKIVVSDTKIAYDLLDEARSNVIAM